MIKKISKTFFRGVLGIVPFALSIYVVVWLITTLEALFDNILFRYLPLTKEIPGVGLVSGLFAIYLIGLLLSLPFFGRFFNSVQVVFKSLPIVKTVYSAIEDLMSYFSPGEEDKGSKVVKVKIPGAHAEMVGLMTQEELSVFEEMKFDDDQVAVFIPLSYAWGGYTIFVKKEQVTLTNMKVDKAMKLALTSWIVKK